MKNLTIACSILLMIAFIPMNLHSQDGSRGGFGIKGGITISTIGFDRESAEDHKNRFRIGGMAGFGYEIPTESFATFEINALYDLRGTKQEADFLNGNEMTQKNYLHYLHFPTNIKFYMGDNVNIHFGPFVSALVGAKAKQVIRTPEGDMVSENDYSLVGENAEDINGNDYLKRVDAGLQIGLEFISNKGVGVGSSFSKGLVDITNDDHVLGSGNARTTEVNVYLIFRP